MIKEENSLTIEMCSRIIQTLLDDFNASQEMIKESRQVSLILELSASMGMCIGEVLILSFEDFRCDGEKCYVNYLSQKTRCRTEAEVPLACYRKIYAYVMEYNVVTLGRLFDVTLGTVKMYLTKVCKTLGYKGIKTYHFSALWANVNDFDKTY